MSNVWETAYAAAEEALDEFSDAHPDVRLNRYEWTTLQEVIARQMVEHFTPNSLAAAPVG